ncbi:hypothetical protein Q4543_00130 [Salipiger sp. 1_MG-2023]|uniref:hypothetical protein n=1 Tax=Salipiger sp. 1_MG-2023 TaxID=3062665 RepID=UPI0026E1A8D5|nr:hypothetical protein [Salipiger sp. 1_MG-2023]MDO6583916.1 hypothetical protein [Salipiger sp. 1_MG-2023]
MRMVPNNALLISSDGIALLRRDEDVWLRLGEMSFADDDPGGALQALSARATGPNGTQVLLILPDDQLRYLALPDPGDDASREAAVSAALDGATPYPVDELVYDWLIGANGIQAAAVARETLAEAEAFIGAHGFTPVGFCAAPQTRDFPGIPFFGSAPGWTGPLPQRPDWPLRITDAPPPGLEQGPPAAQDVPDLGQSDDAVADPLPKAAEPESGAPLPVMQPEAMDAPTPLPDPGPPPAFLATPSPTPPSPTPPNPTAPAPEPEPEPEPEPGVEPAPASFKTGIFGPGGEARATSLAPLPEPAQSPMRPDPARSADAGPDAARFSSMRASRALPEGSKPVQTQSAPPALTTAAPSPKPAEPATPTPAPGVLTPARAKRQDGGAAPSQGGAAKPKPAPAARQSAPPHTAPPKIGPKAAPVDATPVAPVEAQAPRPGFPIRQPLRESKPTQIKDPGEAPPPLQAAMAGPVDLEDERRRMTVFGARRGEDIGGKPRFLGLMLTLVLLLFLLGVAAWAAVFLEEELSRFFGTGDEASEIAATPPPEPAAAPEITAPLPPAPAVEPDVVAVAVPEPAGIAPSPEEAATSYAATGIWQRSPSAPPEATPDTLDDVYVTSVDPKVEKSDAVALPPAAQAEDTPQPMLLPPGPQVRFDLDERGLVRATPEGAVSPDGVRVFTGPPPQVPPPRPTQAGEQAEATPPNATDGPAADPELEARRPSARPGDLIEQSERATQAGFSVAELGGKRPVLRPQTVQPPVTAAIAEALDAPEPAPEQAALAEPDAPEQPTGTDLAVDRSVGPKLRPGNMDSIVRRAEPAPVQTASAAAVRQPAPNIPQNANVARQATIENQLNLRETSLIGVFGSSSNRRALVRLSNGRLQNVKVGDRLDGGRVAAIGEAELQLSKGGRNVVLRMPKG